MTGPADPGGNPVVSVVIVNFNGAALLESCLASVFSQGYAPLEVLVVDNGSTDRSGEVLRSFGSRVRVIWNPDNLGFAEANNQGVAAASGEFIVLLNNDTEVEQGWIPGLLEMCRRDGVGAVTSRVVTDGVPPEYYTRNGSINFLGYNIMRVFGNLSCVFFAGGASLMFRKSIAPIPFLGEYFLYHEDVWLSWRLRLEGYDVRMAQQSVVRHRGSATTRRSSSQRVTYYQERNRLLNALLLYGGWTLVRLLPYFVADALAKILLSVFGSGKSLRGILSAYGWCFRHAAWIRARRHEVQSRRRVHDTAIMALMSHKVLDREGGIAGIVNGLSRVYARVVGLRFHD